jgi:hypothetical protein
MTGNNGPNLLLSRGGLGWLRTTGRLGLADSVCGTQLFVDLHTSDIEQLWERQQRPAREVSGARVLT